MLNHCRGLALQPPLPWNKEQPIFETFRKIRTPFLVNKFLGNFFGDHESKALIGYTKAKLSLVTLQAIEEKLQGIEPRMSTIITTLNLGDGEAAQRKARTQV